MESKAKPKKSAKVIPRGQINFTTYLRKILAQVHPDTGITNSALVSLNAIIFYIGKELSERAEKVARQEGRLSISANTIQIAVRLIIPGELSKHAVSHGTRGVVLFESRASEQPATLPSARVKRFFRSESKDQKYVGASKMRLTANCCVYLAAVLEYLAAEILELSGNAARDDKKQRITPRHMFLVLANDDEFMKMLQRYKISMPGTGVLPYVDARILPEVSTRKTAKTLRKIKKYQKSSGCHFFAKEPFRRLVREIAQDFMTDIRFSAQAMTLMQLYIESYLVQVLTKANMVALHAGRVTVTPKDIALARQVAN